MVLCSNLSSRAETGESASVTVRFERNYAGAHPAEFAALLTQAESIVPSALAYITGQWELPNALHHPLIVTITDVPSKNPGRPVSAFVRSVGSGENLRQWLIIDLEHHLLYPDEDLDGLLYHEMAHAVLRDAVAGPQAAMIPTWFNEGLAQSVTSEGQQRVQEDYKRYGHTDARAVLCDLNGQVDEFLHGQENFGCYTQFYLAVKRLVQRGGQDCMPTIIAGLQSGRPLPEIIHTITALDWGAFQNDIVRFTRDVFSGDQPIP
jgi:hypothetical protein